jgi:plastocyanin
MRVSAVLVPIALVGAGCATGTSGSATASQSRTVLVDYSHDEFASFVPDYFPRKVAVHPGDTVVFKQTWTGEPHSVTMGTLVDPLMEAVKPFIKKAAAGEEIPDEPPAEIAELEKPLPWLYADEGKVAQNGAQPCYLESGTPPTDADSPCPAERQVQPSFNGRQTFYNSGFIPYQGARGNTYSVQFANDIKPGVYNYYCNLHGEFMSGEVEVRPKGAAIPTQLDVNRAARREIDRAITPLVKEFAKAKARRIVPPDEAKAALLKPGEKYFSGNLAGLVTDDDMAHGMINEFVPRTIRTKVGEPVTWVIFGGHTVSFGVPRYFPIIEVGKDGTVTRNPKLDPPAGGSPPLPERAEDEDGPPKPVVIDGGTWDGDGFFSSGLIEPDSYGQYTLRFSKPGRYRYACLVHPPMVATVVVGAT